MGNSLVKKEKDKGQDGSFLVERVLCTEPRIRIGIFLCNRTNLPRQGIRIDDDPIYGLVDMKQYYHIINLFFENGIRLTITHSNQKYGLSLVYHDALIIKEMSKATIKDYKPILFGESGELDTIYHLIVK